MLQSLKHSELSQVIIKFTENECYKEKTGRCSLGEAFERETIEKISGIRNNIEYCQRLYGALVKNTLIYSDIISIARAHCGHYEVSDGRHRLCIYKYMGMDVDEVEIDEGRLWCQNCQLSQNLEGEAKS